MLNKIRTEPEIFAARIDRVVTKKDQDFLKSFHFKGKFRRTKWQQGISCFGVFLIGVLSEQKASKFMIWEKHFRDFWPPYFTL
jgi:hypothetical protein